MFGKMYGKTVYRVDVYYKVSKVATSELWFRTSDTAKAAVEKLKDDLANNRFDAFVSVEDEAGRTVEFKASDFLRVEIQPHTNKPDVFRHVDGGEDDDY